MTHPKTTIFAAILLRFLIAPVAELRSEETKISDKKSAATELDGVWRLLRSRESDKWVDEGKAKFLVFRWNGTQLIIKDMKAFSRRSFTVDSSKTPRHITFDDPKDAKKKYGPSVAIYRLKKDRLLLAVPSDPKKRATVRPKNFKEDGSKWLYEYERLK